MKSPGEYEGERRRFVHDTVEKFKLKKSSVASPTEVMLGKLEEEIRSVLALCKPIQQAGGAVKPSDFLALRHHIFEWTLQRFDKWDRDAMVMLTTTLIADSIANEVEAD